MAGLESRLEARFPERYDEIDVNLRVRRFPRTRWTENSHESCKKIMSNVTLYYEKKDFDAWKKTYCALTICFFNHPIVLKLR